MFSTAIVSNPENNAKNVALVVALLTTDFLLS